MTLCREYTNACTVEGSLAGIHGHRHSVHRRRTECTANVRNT